MIKQVVQNNLITVFQTLAMMGFRGRWIWGGIRNQQIAKIRGKKQLTWISC